MDSRTKRFLISLAAAAVTGWVAGNWLLGPPGYSAGYLETHHGDHELYVETVKNPEFKIYKQRPHLVDLDAIPYLKEHVAFVEQYEAGEDFKSEQHRLLLYTLFFEFFNAGLVVVLVARLAKAPLYKFLDSQIDGIREKMNQAARSRKSAATRLAGIEEKIARLHEVEMKLNAETETRLERERNELATANHYRLGLQERELTERKKAAYHNAEAALQRRLINRAVKELIAGIERGQSSGKQDRLIDEFCRELEAKS